MQASTTLCGITVGVTVLFELPIFHHSAWFLRNMSHDTMLMIAMLAYVVRVYAYTLLDENTVWCVYHVSDGNE